MLLATNASDFDSAASTDPNSYMAQLFAAQQAAAAALNGNCDKMDPQNVHAANSASPSSSSDSGLTNAESKTNLIINYLPQTMSQDEVRSLFSSMGPIESCKLVRDKITGQSLGYAFVNYCRAEDAQRAQKSYNGLRLQNKTIKVSLARPSHETIKGANLYVSGLPKALTQPELESLFTPFGHIITSRILSDNVTGLSKGVGFVRFDRKCEAEEAIEKLNGTMPPGYTEPVQVKFANNPASTTHKAVLQMAQAASALMPLAVLQSAAANALGTRRTSAVPGPIHHQPQVGRFRYSPLGTTQPGVVTSGGVVGGADLLTTTALLQMAQNAQSAQQLAAFTSAAAAAAQPNGLLQAPVASSPTDPLAGQGYCIFVYNLAPEAEESVLWRLFGPFGAVLAVRIIKDFTTNKCKGYGFVTMTNYEDAVAAIGALNGTQLGNRTLQVSFKSQQNAMFR